ncbi:MAG: hypothetical protein ACJ79S_17125 [Gemmatimonadaceae bacterium]
MMQHDDLSGAEGEGAAVATPNCPKCGGEMWDNRESKRNPKAPDFKCKDRGCDGVIWPPRTANGAAAATPGSGPAVAAGAPSCPICGGPMWDDRASKRNPKAPDFKCKDKPRFKGGPGCEGVIWPPRDGKPSPYGQPSARPASSSGGGPAASASRARPSAPAYDAPHSPPPHFDAPPHDDADAPLFEDDDDLPF